MLAKSLSISINFTNIILLNDKLSPAPSQKPRRIKYSNTPFPYITHIFDCWNEENRNEENHHLQVVDI